MKTTFTNPIYRELKSLNFIKDKNLIKISKKTRDKKISVFQDKISKVIQPTNPMKALVNFTSKSLRYLENTCAIP